MLVGGGEAIVVSPLKYIPTNERRGRLRMTRADETNCESIGALEINNFERFVSITWHCRDSGAVGSQECLCAYLSA